METSPKNQEFYIQGILIDLLYQAKDWDFSRVDEKEICKFVYYLPNRVSKFMIFAIYTLFPECLVKEMYLNDMSGIDF